MEIVCNICKLPRQDFYPSRPRECKSCSNARHKAYIYKNREYWNKYVNTVLRKSGTIVGYDKYLPNRNKKTWVSNDLYISSENIKRRIRGDLNSKKITHIRYLECNKHYFLGYIERQFKEGMTWNNYGQGKNKWQYDHIIPLSSAKSLEELISLFYYANVQPLWWHENITKGSRI